MSLADVLTEMGLDPNSLDPATAAQAADLVKHGELTRATILIQRQQLRRWSSSLDRQMGTLKRTLPPFGA